ncbi:MAG TPA: winged helix-turn-helix transcriptional regulator, partial [Nitrososphaerales archaeon]|nr:winged helix-turn-helix transcriptional regulator [Nitrososphaerales archaeon]
MHSEGGRGKPITGDPARSERELDAKFREFAEAATSFVKEASALAAVSYRGEPRSVKDNVNVTKKVFSKWSVEIILSIYSLRSAGFGDLKRLLPGITSQVLSRKLRDLEELEFLQREVIRSRPQKVR